MSWFHFTKQERLQRNRQIRREYAENAKKHTGDNIFLIPHEIEPALKIALDEERTFEEYFREPLPVHLKLALDAEVALWKRLQEQVDHARAATLSEADYDRLKDSFRSYLVVLIDLLHLEEEMIMSCLQRHYVEQTRALQARAAEVPW
jgi:hypothetical protein